MTIVTDRYRRVLASPHDKAPAEYERASAGLRARLVGRRLSESVSALPPNSPVLDARAEVKGAGLAMDPGVVLRRAED